MKRLWKKIVGWFKKEEEIVELVVEKKPEHCSSHNRYKKSCPNCQAIVKIN